MKTIPEIAQEVKKLNKQIEEMDDFLSNIKRRI